MTYLVATLGFTPEPVMAPLRPLRSVHYEAVHVVYGPRIRAEAKSALEEFRSGCSAMGVPLLGHKVGDPFDYSDVLGRMHDIREANGPDYHVNASGGTRIMIMAATMHCFLHDVPLWFHQTGSDPGTLVPLKHLGSLKRLGASKGRLLRLLQRRGTSDMGTLARELGLASSTLTAHVDDLRKAEVLRVEQDGRRRLISLTPEAARLPLA